MGVFIISPFRSGETARVQIKPLFREFTTMSFGPDKPAEDSTSPISRPVEPVAGPRLGLIKVRGVDFVMYRVSSLAEAAKFYRAVLGLHQEMYSEEWQWAEFDCGNVTLALKGGEALPPRTASARIALAVEDVEAAFLELKGNGIPVVREPVDYGVCRALEILDPDGNTIILHQRQDGTWGQSNR